MTFRPYPVLTAASLILLATLIWLGNWQLDRARWKAGLIREAEAEARETPVSLREALCGREHPLGAIVDASDAKAQAGQGEVLRVFGRSVRGEAGWRLFQAAPIDCRAQAERILVETGFDPLPGEALPGPAAALTRLSVAPWPAGSEFSPPNNVADNDWHRFEKAQMEQALGTPLAGDYILEAFDGVPPFLLSVPPVRHYGYAITWFGMAIALGCVYLALHHRVGRLSFSRPKETVG